ncbi:hypothetical protein MGLY_14070 [Neomoorella glycerini]|uniref:Uncharacterized protein n=1 Tax=Neomoorella glycerini TaxID=55779 RepID=A0A6I5ZRJ3_9FIRM|nr:nickel-dependent lactate racemase [Moorella glycerini]QGP92051.1 hypothetical protein MGLY_14070 [Moorella glycerini]
MQVTFPYPGFEPLEVPAGNFLGVFAPRETAPVDEDEVIGNGFQHFIDTGPLVDICRRAKKGATGGRVKVTVVIDDNTRPTPVKKILPYLFRHLAKAGIGLEDITLLVGLGTHRRLSPAELIAKVGPDIYGRVKVVQHDYRDEGNLVHLGCTAKGTPVIVNRLAVESDLLLALGSIVPHRVAGFSGGGKMIQPGISSAATTGQTHWLSARVKGEKILGQVENEVRQEIDAVARLAGLDLIINSVLSPDGRVAGLVIGDLVAAHRQGAMLSRRIYGVNIPEQADIVITDSYPADIEMWQAAKGIYSGNLALKPGGIIILVTPCPEGVAVQHPQIEQFGYGSLAEVEALVARGEIEDLTVAAHLVHVGEVIKEKGTGILVSQGINKETAARIGFIPAASPRVALDMALAMKGKDASIIVLRHGGDILPLVGEE